MLSNLNRTTRPRGLCQSFIDSGTLLDDYHSHSHKPVTRQSGERRHTTRTETSSLTRKQLQFQTRDGCLGTTGENSAIVLIQSLMETFKCHWCLEPNVIL